MLVESRTINMKINYRGTRTNVPSLLKLRRSLLVGRADISGSNKNAKQGACSTAFAGATHGAINHWSILRKDKRAKEAITCNGGP